MSKRTSSLIQKKLGDINHNDIYRYLKNPTVKKFKSLFYTPWFRKIRSRINKKEKKIRRTENSINSIIYGGGGGHGHDDDDDYSSFIIKKHPQIQLPVTYKAFIRETCLLPSKIIHRPPENINNNVIRVIIQYREITTEMKNDNFYHVLHPNSLENVSLIFHQDIHYKCPVCLNDECSLRSAFIYNCGHLMCLSCVSTMMKSFPESSPVDLFTSCYYKCN